MQSRNLRPTTPEIITARLLRRSHSNGQVYRTRIDPDGVERDDHCATPNWAEKGEKGHASQGI